MLANGQYGQALQAIVVELGRSLSTYNPSTEQLEPVGSSEAESSAEMAASEAAVRVNVAAIYPALEAEYVQAADLEEEVLSEYVEVAAHGHVSDFPPQISYNTPYHVPHVHVELVTKDVAEEEQDTCALSYAPPPLFASITGEQDTCNPSEEPSATIPEHHATSYVAPALAVTDLPYVAKVPSQTRPRSATVARPAVEPTTAPINLKTVRIQKAQAKPAQRESDELPSGGDAGTWWVFVPMTVFIGLFAASMWYENYAQEQTALVAAQLRKLQLDYKVCELCVVFIRM